MSVALSQAVRGMLVLVLLTPFVIAPEVFAHFSVSKAIYSRVLIEIMFVAWVFLALSFIALTQAYGYSFIPGVLAKRRVDATLGNPSYLAPILVIAILVSAGLLVRSLLEPGKPETLRRIGWKASRSSLLGRLPCGRPPYCEASGCWSLPWGWWP